MLPVTGNSKVHACASHGVHGNTRMPCSAAFMAGNEFCKQTLLMCMTTLCSVALCSTASVQIGFAYRCLWLLLQWAAFGPDHNAVDSAASVRN